MQQYHPTAQQRAFCVRAVAQEGGKGCAGLGWAKAHCVRLLLLRSLSLPSTSPPACSLACRLPPARRRRPFLVKALENVLQKFVMGMEFYDDEGRRKIAIGALPCADLAARLRGGWSRSRLWGHAHHRCTCLALPLRCACWLHPSIPPPPSVHKNARLSARAIRTPSVLQPWRAASP